MSTEETEFSEEYKRGQRANWNGLSAEWNQWHDQFETGGSAVTHRLLQESGISAGDNVLDVGTGTGEPAISTAKLVGPQGSVRSIDQAAEMVNTAQVRAEGIEQLTFDVADAEIVDLTPNSFNSVLSRWTLMFLPNRLETLKRFHAALKDDGVLAAVAWRTPDEAPVISAAFGVAAKLLDLPAPPPGLPGPFSMSDPDTVINQFKEAGFADVRYDRCDAIFDFASPEIFARFAVDLLPGGIKKTLSDKFGSEQSPDVLDAVSQTVSAHVESGSLKLPSGSWCYTARK